MIYTPTLQLWTNGLFIVVSLHASIMAVIMEQFIPKNLLTKAMSSLNLKKNGIVTRSINFNGGGSAQHDHSNQGRGNCKWNKFRVTNTACISSN